MSNSCISLPLYRTFLHLLHLSPSSIVSALPSPSTADEDEDDEESAPTAHAEADDDGRVYKNPRNSPSAQCPRDEEQATLLVRELMIFIVTNAGAPDVGQTGDLLVRIPFL